MKHTDPPIINEHTFNRPARDVWNALSVQKEMVQWFFDNIPAFEARVGFETRFAVQSENRTFTHCWKVLEAIPNQKLTYSWKYEEYPGDATVTFELNERGNTTDLKLTLHVLEDFPDEIPEFKRESCIGGWDYFLRERLKEYLKE